MKRIAAALLSVLFLSGCGTVRTAQTDLHDVPLARVWATSSAAYYLGQDGTLYSPGADSDAASYVCYLDKKRGIVVENVRFFEEIVGGGCYINGKKELCLWNENDLPLYGYHKKDGHAAVCDGVVFVKCCGGHMIFLKENAELYLAGSFGGEDYPIDKAKLLGRDVVSADTDGNLVVWADASGEIFSYGDEAGVAWFERQEWSDQFRGTAVTGICLQNDYAAVLSSGDFWLCSENDMELKCENIKEISCTREMFVALESDGAVRVWGKCVANDAEKTKIPEYCTLNGEKIADEAISVWVSGGCLCYVDKNGKSHVYYAGGWPGFYGNATKDTCVGIGREPNTWVEK